LHWLSKSLILISHHCYCIISHFNLLPTTNIKLQILAKGTKCTSFFPHAYQTLKCHILHQYAFKFTLCFTRFLVNLNKFTMVKVGNPFTNGDELLWTSEFTNGYLNSLTIKSLIINLIIIYRILNNKFTNN
jgi:hypothetical protein